MRVGYARVSTTDQSTDSQLDALTKAGCERVWTDHGISGSKVTRPELDDMLGHLRSGDEVVVYSLSRLGRSTRHLLELVERFDVEGVTLVSITESIDTSTPTGRMIVTVLAAVAQMELEMTRERTMAGLEAARKRGRIGGRPRAMTADQIEAAVRLRRSGSSIREIAAALGVSRSVVHRETQLATEQSVLSDTVAPPE